MNLKVPTVMNHKLPFVNENRQNRILVASSFQPIREALKLDPLPFQVSLDSPSATAKNLKNHIPRDNIP